MGLKVRIDGDGSGFSATLDKLANDAKNFGSKLSANVSGNFSQAIMGIVPGLTEAIGGIFSAEAVKRSLADFAEQGEKIKFGALKMNVDPTQYQQIKRVMEETGQSAEDIVPFFDNVAKSLTEIEENGKHAGKLREDFARLGISGDDMSLSYQDVAMKIVEVNKGLEITKEKLTALHSVGKRSVDALLPAMGMGGFNSDFAKAGIIDQADLDAIEQANKSMRALDAASAGFFNHLKANALATPRVLLGMFAQAIGHFGYVPNDLGKAILSPLPNTTSQQDAEADAKQKAAAMQAINKSLQEQAVADRKKFDKEDASKAASIDKETAALRERNREAGMTPEEKRLDLLKQIASMEGELKYGGGDLGKAGEAELRQKIAKAQGEIGVIDRKKPKREHEHHSMMERLGNASIGGIMLSHGGDAMTKHAATTAKHVASMDRKMKPAKAAPANNDFE